MIKLTLGTDSAERKNIQLVAACLRYIPAALARFALHSKAGNDKHNPGQPVHHARGKSMDHEECILRHLVDLQDIRAYIDREGLAFDVHVNPEHARAVTMLIDEATAEFWRAGVFLQELCETYLGAPLAPAAVEPPPPSRCAFSVDKGAYMCELDKGHEGPCGSAVPSGTDDGYFGAAVLDALVREFTAPGDPAKLPQVVYGKPWGCPWAITGGDGRLLSTHSSHADAESCLRVMLAAPPVNTPEELAELEKMGGKVVLVGGPGIVDGGELRTIGGVSRVYTPEEIAAQDGPGAEDGPEFDGYAERAGHGFPLFPECPSERGNGVDEEGLERCGAMSRTKRVCTRMGGHAGAHADAVAHWAGIE